MKINVNKGWFRGCVGVVLFSVGACSHGPAVQEFPETASPGAEISNLEGDITRAASNQADVLSPQNFKKSVDALNNAKRGLDRQKDSKDILHDVAEGKAYLNRAKSVMDLANNNMESVVQARQRALTAGAAGFYKKEFSDADKALKDTTEDLEENDLKAMEKNRIALQDQYLGLELMAIKQNNLGAAWQNIQQARKEGAREFAPRSLALAEKNYKDTDEYINANRQNTEEVKSRSSNAVASAEHALKITRQSKVNKKAAPEEVALQMEQEQNKVANKEVQLEQKQSELENKDSQLQSQKSMTSALAKEQVFQQIFETAQTQFDSNEAEVYKQGNALLIRLKGLEFPSNKAVLKEHDFPLLAKVQNVIKSFGPTSVVVEGHTDSVGGKNANERLSKERASAVREYLVSNDAVDEEKVKAVGYGFQRPLASNKTRDGRAQNRRVDILITPEHENKSSEHSEN